MMGERERRMKEGERRNMQISFELQPLLDIFETTRIDRMNIPRVIGVECDFSYSFKCDDRSMMMNSRCVYYFFCSKMERGRFEDFYGNLCSQK